MNRGSIALLVVPLVACAMVQRVDTPRTEGPDKSYSVDLPVGWIKQVNMTRQLLVSRDGPLLEYILITKTSLKEAFPKTKKAASDSLLPAELAELEIAEIKSQDQLTEALTVVENEPAEIGGVEGFRVRVRYKNTRGLEIQRVVYGFTDKSGYYQLAFEAPMLYYFDTYYPHFQRAVASFQLSNGSRKSACIPAESIGLFKRERYGV